MSEFISILIVIAVMLIFLIPAVTFWAHCIDDLEQDKEFQAHKNDQEWLDKHYPWP